MFRSMAIRFLFITAGFYGKANLMSREKIFPETEGIPDCAF